MIIALIYIFFPIGIIYSLQFVLKLVANVFSKHL